MIGMYEDVGTLTLGRTFSRVNCPSVHHGAGDTFAHFERPQVLQEAGEPINLDRFVGRDNSKQSSFVVRIERFCLVYVASGCNSSSQL